MIIPKRPIDYPDEGVSREAFIIWANPGGHVWPDERRRASFMSRVADPIRKYDMWTPTIKAARFFDDLDEARQHLAAQSKIRQQAYDDVYIWVTPVQTFIDVYFPKYKEEPL